MKKIIYAALIAGMVGFTACDDFLETSSPSVVDGDFVFSNTTTARAALDGAYESWRDIAQNRFFGDGLYYASEVTGSDIERHPEAFSNQPGRHYPECLYQNGTYCDDYGLLSYLSDDDSSPYNSGYSTISTANAIISAMEEMDEFEEVVTNATSASDLSQIYGEAVALRATVYRELLHYYGDVPYSGQFGVAVQGLTSRDSIYDIIIDQLIEVAPLMYPLGSIPDISTSAKNYFTQTYVYGLIGRIALEAGGYQTRRADLGSSFYVDGDGNVLSYETLGNANSNAENAVYGRRSDWQDLYQIAKTYFKLAIDNPGTAKFYTTDPRSNESDRIYENPYQYFFEQMMQADDQYADESIYEYPMAQGGGNDARPYSFGRPSSGGSSNAYPCKSYGQGRINPAYFYGIFDPTDKRRDVSVAITGSTGAGVETLIPFTPNSKAAGGGPSLNKWDENRMTTVWTAAQRKSGINGPYMRMAEMYLGYAEACAALGDNSTAKTYLEIVRQRSFPDGEDNTDEFISECGSTLHAVIEERGFEFAGEGDRRWTLIRSGYFPEAIQRIKELTREMIDGLSEDGYYEFDNGNVISSYIWTKLVDMSDEGYSYRLTAQTPEGDYYDPILSPGWRGQNDTWEDYGLTYSSTKTNLAIEGLFEYIEPGSAEALALEADGYSQTDWGIELVENDDEYYKYLFYDYDYVSAPIYLWPFTPTIMSTGGFDNGYGFKDE